MVHLEVSNDFIPKISFYVVEEHFLTYFTHSICSILNYGNYMKDFLLALVVYLNSLPWHNNLQTAYGLFTIAHIFYILSFTSSIQRLWFEWAIAVIIYVGAFLYFCFVDLFWSIPVLALSVSFHFITLAISLIIAGSIWYYGSDRENMQVVCNFQAIFGLFFKIPEIQNSKYGNLLALISVFNYLLSEQFYSFLFFRCFFFKFSSFN